MSQLSFSTININNEELLVAELEQLGVRYLSRLTNEKVRQMRPPHKLLADLIQQPSSRVRSALIALLLARPSYGEHILQAMRQLTHDQAETLKLFYTAAVLLQREYTSTLQTFLGADYCWLTDFFSTEFNLPVTNPKEQLKALATLHQQKTGRILNWAGTYQNAALHLLRRWELEQIWSL